MTQLYTSHANQRLISENTAKNRVVVAGRRFGKSALGLNEAIARASLVKGQIIWIILPLYRQAKEIYWIDPDITKYFMPMVQSGGVKADKSELSLHFKKTNSWVRLKGSDNYDSLRGSGLDLIIWDEVADVKQEAFDTIEPALADSPDHRQLYIGTPKGLNWFHDFALKGDHKKIIPDFGKQIKSHKDWMTWHFTSYDNLAWPEGSKERTTFVDYIDEKKAEAEEKGKLSWFNQEYMASFEEGAGRFFPKWNFNTHGLDKSIIPLKKYTVYSSMDWGRTAPFSSHLHVLLPVKHEGVNFKRLVTFKEEYSTGKSPHGQIKELTRKFDYDRVDKILTDPSMMNPLSDGSMSITDQMIKAFEELRGIRPSFKRGSRNRIARWAAMENWMRVAVDGLPYWMITKDCPNLIRTIPMMMPDENNPEDLDTKLEDHACLSADTKILTQKGIYNIIDVQQGDKVWTPIGWSKVLWSGQTGMKDLSIYRGIKATSNHPFLTQDGFRPSKGLKETDRLWNVFTSRVNLTEDIQIHQDFPIQSIFAVVQRRMQATQAHSTDMFGNILRGNFPKAIIYITKMIVGMITLLKISKYTLIPNIKRYIGRKITEKGLKLVEKTCLGLLRLLRNGTEAKKEGSGTVNMQKELWQIEKVLSKGANYAEKNLRQLNLSLSTAAPTTKPLLIGKQKVYNLVTDAGMYTANNAVVSNCDDVSYFITWLKWVDSTKIGGIHQKRPRKVKQPMITKLDLDAFARIKKSKRTYREV